MAAFKTIDDHLALVRVVGLWRCWKLPHRLIGNGYVQFQVGRKRCLAHRAVYEHLIGPISKPTLDHLCRRRWCCNPNHVEPATHRENTLRGNSIQAKNARKVRCRRGHPLSGSNLRVWNGGRYCRRCQAVHSRNAYRRNHQEIT